MLPLFSASGSGPGEGSAAEIQLLTDQELMALWEQTQVAVAVIESRGGMPNTARRYEKAVLFELQRRLAQRPAGELFGTKALEDPLPDVEALPHIMMVQA